VNFHIYILVFLSTVICILLLRPLAFRFGLLDIPNNRKIHQGSVPLTGGVAMFIGVISALIFESSFTSSYYNSFVLSSLILLILGLIDDLKNISPLKRFVFQILSSLIIIYLGGVLIEDLGSLLSNQNISLGIFAVAFSVVSILGVLNSLNFSDGIDGLSASLSLVTFSSIAFFVYHAKDYESLNFLFYFIFSIAAFLVFNIGLGRNSAFKVFMGDAGSTFLGLGIAFLLISFSQSNYAFFSPVVALWIYGIPLVDSVSIMIRRIVKGKSPFHADREHLHHYLISMGYSDRQTLGIIVFLALVLAFIGIAFELNSISENIMFSSFILFAFLYYFLLSYAWRKININ
jgi:UDP-GlcNAc:undecaprenyl-phosphate/decaprenyl-phosphate GlcNAc-1-phosphate transferase